MALPLEQFVKHLEDSGVIAADTLKEFLPPKGEPKDAEELARELVRQKMLTKFQAEELWKGKGKSLVLGNYVLREKIGQGGMGAVYKAEHRRMQRTVAIKMLPPAMLKDAAAAARFQREVVAAAKLRHTNIVAADDADEADGVHFLVMEYVDGSDLSALVKKNGPLPVAHAVNYILQAARGLEFAHREGVVHRDIKPANLLLDKRGTVKILDMGLARIQGDTAGQAELTGTGAIMGTVDYMAPEQALSTKHADARADIYSLGCSLYYLLTGRATYDGETLTAKLLAHQNAPIPALQSALPEVPEQVAAVFQRMVAKKVGDRFQTMTEVIRDLEAIRGEGQNIASRGTPPQPVDAASQDSELLSFLGNLDQSNTVKTTGAVHAAGSPSPVAGIKASTPGQSVRPHLSSTGNATERHARGIDKFPASNRKLVLAGGATATVALLFTLFWAFRGNEREKPTGAKNATASGGRKSADNKIADQRKSRKIGKIPPLAIAPFDAKQAKAHQAAWAGYLNVPVEFTNRNGMKFRMIPPGEFLMGSTQNVIAAVTQMANDYGEGWEPPYIQSEHPQHKVRITKPFYLGVYEVTRSEFNHTGTLKDGITDRVPAGGMTYDEMIAFCKRLGTSDHFTYRLPTEAEWEYACRAGTTTHFAFGDSLSPTQANFEGAYPFGDAPKGPSIGNGEVGSFQPNAFGLYDMHGNFWEMCSDWYAADYYEHSPTDDPAGPAFGNGHVERGGDRDGSRGFACRSAARHSYSPPWPTIGIRIVREID